MDGKEKNLEDLVLSVINEAAEDQNYPSSADTEQFSDENINPDEDIYIPTKIMIPVICDTKRLSPRQQELLKPFFANNLQGRYIKTADKDEKFVEEPTSRVFFCGLKPDNPKVAIIRSINTKNHMAHGEDKKLVPVSALDPDVEKTDFISMQEVIQHVNKIQRAKREMDDVKSPNEKALEQDQRKTLSSAGDSVKQITFGYETMNDDDFTEEDQKRMIDQEDRNEDGNEKDVKENLDLDQIALNVMSGKTTIDECGAFCSGKKPNKKKRFMNKKKPLTESEIIEIVKDQGFYKKD